MFASGSIHDWGTLALFRKMTWWVIWFWFSLLAFFASARASELESARPILTIEPNGSASLVTALAFSPDGKTLYAGGFDKVVRVWQQNAAGQFEFDPKVAYRVPATTGQSGAINAIAISPDGRWLAVGGRGAYTDEFVQAQSPGMVIPSSSLTKEFHREVGKIYVFDLRDGSAHALQGHQGPIMALEFAPGESEFPVLISAANEEGKKILRMWNVLENRNDAAQLAQIELTANSRVVPKGSELRPQIAVQRNGSTPTSLNVVAAWGNQLFVWDASRTTQGLTEIVNNTQYNFVSEFLPDRKSIIAGLSPDFRQSFAFARWKIAGESWTLTGDTARFPARNGVFSIPMELKFVSHARRGLLATVLRRQSDNGVPYYELVLLDSAPQLR